MPGILNSDHSDFSSLSDSDDSLSSNSSDEIIAWSSDSAPSPAPYSSDDDDNFFEQAENYYPDYAPLILQARREALQDPQLHDDDDDDNTEYDEVHLEQKVEASKERNSYSSDSVPSPTFCSSDDDFFEEDSDDGDSKSSEEERTLSDLCQDNIENNEAHLKQEVEVPKEVISRSCDSVPSVPYSGDDKLLVEKDNGEPLGKQIASSDAQLLKENIGDNETRLKRKAEVLKDVISKSFDSLPDKMPSVNYDGHLVAEDTDISDGEPLKKHRRISLDPQLHEDNAEDGTAHLERKAVSEEVIFKSSDFMINQTLTTNGKGINNSGGESLKKQRTLLGSQLREDNIEVDKVIS